MKNIQAIDAADNCTYDVYAATDDEFRVLFESNTDVEFVEDIFTRLGDDRAQELLSKIWKRPVPKKEVHGIDGTLFSQLTEKKAYYPTKKESEMIASTLT